MLWADFGTPSPHVFVFVNAHSASLRARDAAYAAALENPHVIGLADGFAIELGSRWTRSGVAQRSPGPDFFEHACARAAQEGGRFFLLGGAPGVAPALARSLQQRYPGLEIAGTATPPFGIWPEAISLELAQQVRSSGADVLWLGVSAPKQETWALAHLGATGVPTVCVGAAFDFLSGAIDRAPAWMRANGLEWLYRLTRDPRRLWRRYIFGNARFLYDLARYGSRDPRAR